MAIDRDLTGPERRLLGQVVEARNLPVKAVLGDPGCSELKRRDLITHGRHGSELQGRMISTDDGRLLCYALVGEAAQMLNREHHIILDQLAGGIRMRSAGADLDRCEELWRLGLVTIDKPDQRVRISGLGTLTLAAMGRIDA